MKDTNKVLPCPFCGNKDIVTDHMTQTYPAKLYDVYCARCGCGTMSFNEKEHAIRNWNRRIPMNKITNSIREIGNIQFSSFSKPLIAVEDVIKIIEQTD